MKHDISIHFTIKGQTVSELNKKLSNYFDENQDELVFDFSEQTEPRSILHHCFLPESLVKEKGFSNEIYDELLDPLSENKVCWYNTSSLGLIWDRVFMLENLSKLNGVAVFIGEIKEGVKEEFDVCKELGIEVIHIQ